MVQLACSRYQQFHSKGRDFYKLKNDEGPLDAKSLQHISSKVTVIKADLY